MSCRVAGSGIVTREVGSDCEGQQQAAAEEERSAGDDGKVSNAEYGKPDYRSATWRQVRSVTGCVVERWSILCVKGADEVSCEAPQQLRCLKAVWSHQ